MKLIKINNRKQRKNTNDPFYQSSVWKKLRKFKLSMTPHCEECARKGIANSAEMVDHVNPISQGADPTDYNNLQSLCNHCHAVKRAQESNKAQQTI